MPVRWQTIAGTFAVLAQLLAPVWSSSAAEADLDEVLATVEGREVRQSDLDRAQASFASALEAMPILGEGDPQLERYVNFRLIAAAARDAGLAEDPEVRRTIEQMSDLVLYRTFMVHFEHEIGAEAALLEEQARERTGDGELRQVHARHIRTEDRPAAEKVIRALEGGADFAYLAEQHSIAPTAEKGGDLGFVGPDDLAPALIEVAFALDPGDFSPEPVETAAGWEILKVEARRVQKAPITERREVRPKEEVIDGALVALLTRLRERAGLDTTTSR